jgi:hypothetical protein
MAEHPVSTISSYFRKPDRSFHPWQYAAYTKDDDNYTKLTNIWHSPNFVWPEPRAVAGKPDVKRIWHVPPSGERKNIRSKTPDGFARAVWMANSGRALPAAGRPLQDAGLFSEQN